MQGLDFLFSPTGQAYQAGQNMFQNEQRNLKDVLANQQSAAMNPLLVEQQRLANQTTGAALPGVRGNAASLEAKGRVDTAGVEDKISGNHLDFLDKQDTHQLKQINTLGTKFGYMGSVLEQIPAPARGAALQDVATKFGVDLNQPAFSRLGQLPPDQLPVVFKKMGEEMAMSSADAINKRLLQDMKNQGSANVANINASSREKVAALSAQARAQEKANIYDKLPSAKAKHAFALSKIADAQSRGDEAAFGYWSAQEEIVRTQAEHEIASPKPGTPDVGGFNLPTNERPNLAPPSAKPAPEAPKVMTKEQVDAAGMTYDPNYEYAVIDGKVKRRPIKR